MDIFNKKQKSFGIACILIFFNLNLVYSQIQLKEDSISEILYSEMKYKDVVALSKKHPEAFSNEKLRLRKALSNYFLNNYSSALMDLEILAKDQSNSIAKNYYNLCLEKLSKNSDIEWIKYNKDKKYKIQRSLLFYNGVIMGEAKQIPDYKGLSKDVDYAQLIFPLDVYSHTLLLNSKVNPLFSYTIGGSYNHLQTVNVVSDSVEAKSRLAKWNQSNVYFNFSHRPVLNFEWGLFGNFFNSKGSIFYGEKNKYNTYNYYSYQFSKNGYAIGAHTTFYHPFFTLELNPSYFSFNSVNQLQLENSLTYLPFGNHSFYLVGKVFLQKEKASIKNPLNISFGRKFSNKFWFRLGYFHGNNNNLVAYGGSGILTSLDNTKKYIDFEGYFFLKKFTLQPRVVIYDRSINLYTPTQANQTSSSSFTYQRAQFSLIIKYTL